jgi:hypothetical protein
MPSTVQELSKASEGRHSVALKRSEHLEALLVRHLQQLSLQEVTNVPAGPRLVRKIVVCNVPKDGIEPMVPLCVRLERAPYVLHIDFRDWLGAKPGHEYGAHQLSSLIILH